MTSTALAGGFWSDHVEPLFEVLMTYGVELRLVPTAMQVVSLVTGDGVQQCPDRDGDWESTHVRSTVLVSVAPPPFGECRQLHRSIPRRTRRWMSDVTRWLVEACVQVPPSVSPTIDGRLSTMPTATQVSGVGARDAFKNVSPEWRRLRVPSGTIVVPTILSPPTAVHSSIVKQEIDRGGKRRVLDRPGRAAVARLHRFPHPRRHNRRPTMGTRRWTATSRPTGESSPTRWCRHSG